MDRASRSNVSMLAFARCVANATSLRPRRIILVHTTSPLYLCVGQVGAVAVWSVNVVASIIALVAAVAIAATPRSRNNALRGNPTRALRRSAFVPPHDPKRLCYFLVLLLVVSVALMSMYVAYRNDRHA